MSTMEFERTRERKNNLHKAKGVTTSVSGFSVSVLGFLFAPRTSNGVAMVDRPPAPLLLTAARVVPI